jgi:hypothetical protein
MSRNLPFRRFLRSLSGYGLIAMSLLAACGPPSGPPKPDSCKGARADGITSLTIGPKKLVDSSPFREWSDGDAPTTAYGGQGAPMLVLRIDVAGDAPPSCLSQDTEVWVSNQSYPDGKERLGGDSTPRKTYAQLDGSRATDDVYVVMDYSSSANLSVTTRVGALSVTRTLGFVIHDLAVRVDMPALDLGGTD